MSLADDLKRFAELSIEKQDRVVKSSFIQLGNEMEFKSPVDTGRFKSNWIGAIGRIDDSTTNSTARNAVGELSLKLGAFRLGDVFYYTNSLPYAQMLEFGLSEQAPAGMVRLTARRWNKIVSDNIKANQ
jgi:hypothetical protein